MKEKGTLGYGKLCNVSSLRINTQSFIKKCKKNTVLLKQLAIVLT